METYTKLCLVCGKEFAKKVNCSRKDWSIQEFCSKNCSAKYQYKDKISKYKFRLGQKALNPIRKGEHRGRKTEFKKGHIPWHKNKTIRETRNCGYCKKEFLARLIGKGLYCSYKCRGLAQRVNNPWKECVVCKKPFQKNENKKRWEERKVCSRKCQYEIQGLKGEKNHKYKGGITPLMVKIRTMREYVAWVRFIFRRDDWTCQLCKARSGNGKKIILNADHYPKAFSIIIKENKIDSI